MDRGRQHSRRTGRVAGGVAGAFLGLFGSFIAFAAVTASRMGPHAAGLRPPAPTILVPAFFGSVIGGLLIGALAGSWLGGLMAGVFYCPTPDGTLPPKINKGWVVAGALLGWVVGAAVGMGLATVTARLVQAMWVMPVVFFSPAVLCLLLGGFAGWGFAQAGGAADGPVTAPGSARKLSTEGRNCVLGPRCAV